MVELVLDVHLNETSIAKLEGQQLSLLKKQLSRVYENSPYYKAKFQKFGFHPSDLTSLDDIRKVPFTTRDDLEKNYESILAVPRSSISTIRMSSGTSGSPLKIAHTKHDVEMIADASARRLSYHGLTSEDVVQITSAYGMWQGAWSMHWGAEKIGACSSSWTCR